ncbi:MAG: hypothetical protein WB609_09380 [Candidatus Cybelea sp.]
MAWISQKYDDRRKDDDEKSSRAFHAPAIREFRHVSAARMDKNASNVFQIAEPEPNVKISLPSFKRGRQPERGQAPE